jgi:hypothetical protein
MLLAALLALTPSAASAVTFSFTGYADGGSYSQTCSAVGGCTITSEDTTPPKVFGTLTIDTAAIAGTNQYTAPATYYEGGAFITPTFQSNGVTPQVTFAGSLFSVIDADPDLGYLTLQFSSAIDTFNTFDLTLSGFGPFETADYDGVLLPDLSRLDGVSFSVTSRSGTADSFVERVSIGTIGAVPEASTWATMTVGFALAGAALRRRRRATALA